MWMSAVSHGSNKRMATTRSPILCSRCHPLGAVSKGIWPSGIHCRHTTCAAALRRPATLALQIDVHMHCKLMCTCTHTPLCASIGMWHHTGVHTLLWNRCFVKVAHMRHSQGFNSHPSSSFECFDRETKCVIRSNLNVCAAQARTQCQRRHGLVIRSNLPTSLQPYSM